MDHDLQEWNHGFGVNLLRNMYLYLETTTLTWKYFIYTSYLSELTMTIVAFGFDENVLSKFL